MKRNPIFMIIFFCALPLLCYAVDIKSEYDILVEQYHTDAPGMIDTDKMDFEKTPFNKLGRGLINVSTCWGEVFADFFETSKAKDPVVGATVGVAQGLVTSLYRAASGLYDIATFPFPPYDKPPMKPEYALKHAEESADSFNAKSRLFSEE